MVDETLQGDETLSDGTRIVYFACRDGSYPDDVYYRMHYFDTATGATLLRFDDSAHGRADRWHHQHTGETEADVAPVEFTDINDHFDTFLDRVEEIHHDRTRD